MIGLIDCNNFFASCECVFNPALLHKPFVVLSNNDGCVVSMSKEAKQIGVKRGVAIANIQDLIEKHDILIYSSNYKLYGDMSSRVMSVLSSLVPKIEIYSIDEAFIDLEHISSHEVENLGREIVRQIRRSTGIPTSLGIAPTKTLAKIAVKYAKNDIKYRGVYCMDSKQKYEDALKQTIIKDVWGIGRKLGDKLMRIGILDAFTFVQNPPKSYSTILNSNGIGIWKELKGMQYFEFESNNTTKKQICSSRSFAEPLENLDELQSAISCFSENVCIKLQRQRSCAISIEVFLYPTCLIDVSKYSIKDKLEEPTNDMLTINQIAIKLISTLYKVGIGYKKAGIIISDLIDESSVQNNLFYPHDIRKKHKDLSQVLIELNNKNTLKEKVCFASKMVQRELSRNNHQSPQYTTKFDEIITIKCVD